MTEQEKKQVNNKAILLYKGKKQLSFIRKTATLFLGFFGLLLSERKKGRMYRLTRE
jgi:hypothetical protein